MVFSPIAASSTGPKVSSVSVLMCVMAKAFACSGTRVWKWVVGDELNALALRELSEPLCRPRASGVSSAVRADAIATTDGVKHHGCCWAAMARACSSCSAVSTERDSPSTGKVPIWMPASINRNCSNFSVCSKGEWGSWFQPISTSAR